MPAPIVYYPEYYQDWLFAALEMNPGDEVSSAILEPLYLLNRRWVKQEEEAQVVDYSQQRHIMRAYACYFMTIHMPKLWFVLNRCATPLTRFLEQRERVTLTELGCGSGTFLWAFLFWLRQQRPDLLPRVRLLHGIDRSGAALAIAARLGEGLRAQPEFAHLECRFSRDEWQQRLGEQTDILFFGNVLTENEPIAGDWAGQLRCALPIFIEPGTSQAFSKVLPMRDALLAHGWHILYPCPTAHPCPMAGTDNWCHFHINRFTLPFIQRMSGVSGKLNPRHHFTGFVFSREGQLPPQTWRLLSDLRRAKRNAIRYVCDGEHHFEAVLARRDKTEANRSFMEALKGDAGVLATPRSPAEFITDRHIRAGDSFTLVDASPAEPGDVPEPESGPADANE